VLEFILSVLLVVTALYTIRAIWLMETQWRQLRSAMRRFEASLEALEAERPRKEEE